MKDSQQTFPPADRPAGCVDAVFPVVLHIAVAAAPAFGCGVAQVAQKIGDNTYTRRHDIGANAFLSQMFTNRLPESPGKTGHGCMLANPMAALSRQLRKQGTRLGTASSPSAYLRFYYD